MVGHLWLSDRHVVDVASCTTQQTQETNVHNLGGIRISDPSSQAASDSTTTATLYGHYFFFADANLLRSDAVYSVELCFHLQTNLEMSGTTQSHIPEDLSVQQCRCDNLKDWCVGCITADIAHFTYQCPCWAALFFKKFLVFYRTGIYNAVSTTVVHWQGAEKGCGSHDSSFFIYHFNIFLLSASVTSERSSLSGFQIQCCVNPLRTNRICLI